MIARIAIELDPERVELRVAGLHLGEELVGVVATLADRLEERLNPPCECSA
jgi:hypothetical protein